jgi:hypothetical protein
MMKRTLLLIVFLLCGMFMRAQHPWALIYENDASGSALQGNFQELLEAVRNGQEIRIYFIMGDPNQAGGHAEHLVDVPFLTILNTDKGQTLYAQISEIKGQVPDMEGNRLGFHEAYEWTLLASTNGENEQLIKNPLTGEVIFQKKSRWGTKWFVRK